MFAKKVLNKYKRNLSGYKREMDLVVSTIEGIIPGLGHRGEKDANETKETTRRSEIFESECRYLAVRDISLSLECLSCN